MINTKLRDLLVREALAEATSASRSAYASRETGFNHKY